MRRRADELLGKPGRTANEQPPRLPSACLSFFSLFFHRVYLPLPVASVLGLIYAVHLAADRPDPGIDKISRNVFSIHRPARSSLLFGKADSCRVYRDLVFDGIAFDSSENEARAYFKLYDLCVRCWLVEKVVYLDVKVNNVCTKGQCGEYVWNYCPSDFSFEFVLR